jgi:hypothetical protein
MNEYGEHFDGQIYVANILTRAWKQLPLPPYLDTGGQNSYFKLVMTDRSSETYRLIQILNHLSTYLISTILCQIYDSTSESWSSQKVSVSVPFLEHKWDFQSCINIGYREGVLYMNPERQVSSRLQLWP